MDNENKKTEEQTHTNLKVPNSETLNKYKREMIKMRQHFGKKSITFLKVKKKDMPSVIDPYLEEFPYNRRVLILSAIMAITKKMITYKNAYNYARKRLVEEVRKKQQNCGAGYMMKFIDTIPNGEKLDKLEKKLWDSYEKIKDIPTKKRETNLIMNGLIFITLVKNNVKEQNVFYSRMVINIPDNRVNYDWDKNEIIEKIDNKKKSLVKTFKLNPDFKEILEKFNRTNGYIFRNHNGKKFNNTNGMARMIEKIF